MPARRRSTRSTKSTKPTKHTFFECAVDRVLKDGEPEVGDYLGEFLNLIGADERGLSEYWRKNLSQLEAAELANVLRALRKVAGHIGQNVGRIEWAGMSGDGEGGIVLDPGLVAGKYPLPSRKFDYLVGLVTHESIHRTQWSDLVWKKVDEACGDMKMKISDKIIFQKIVHTGEDIYVDHISEHSILGSYTLNARNLAIEMAKQGLKPVTSVDELMVLWWKSAFGEEVDSGPYEEPLAILDNLTRGLIEVGRSGRGVTARCEFRSDLYVDIWEKVRDLISSWRVIDKMLLWYPPSKEEEKKDKPDKGKKRKKSRLRKEVAMDIETRLAIDSSDITPLIRSVVGEDDEDVVPTSRWDFNMTAHPVIDQKIVSRLKAICQTYADRKTVISRGLKSGKVDRRRLYRAPITGRCFLDKQKIPVLDWNICLLVDASGSMRGRKWRMVENAMGNMHRAFRGFQHRLQAYAYFEVEGVCMISKLIEGSELLSIPPAGQTASGQAIIAAAYFMPRDTRRRFLIHITDGQANCGCNVQSGLDYCRAQNIHLVTLGVAYRDRTAMEEQYGKAIQFLDHFGQLPGALENLLKWTLLYERRAMPRPTGGKMQAAA